MFKPQAGLFLFGIPLVPRSRANNWNNVLENLGTTLRSILNQTNKEFHILIASEDEFDLPELSDKHVQLLKMPISGSKPVTFSINYQDAVVKRLAICQKAHELCASQLMLADADDLISKNLVEFVRRNPHPVGYAITRGFVLDCNTGKNLVCPSLMVNVKGFDTLCGTSLIYTLNQHKDLPENWPASVVKNGHNQVRRAMREAGTPMLEIHEPMVVYVRNSGENISMHESEDNPYLNFGSYLTSAIATHGAPFTKEQIHEFGLHLQ